MKNVLVADTLPETCVALLKDADLTVDYRPGLALGELEKAVKGAHGIICRSGAKVTEDVIFAADDLEAICRAGVGVNNIDVGAASRKGVVVMNTPGANTVSTAEHAFALMLALARNICPANIAMRAGRWEKKRYVGCQLEGSTLAVIGLGRIGQTVARRAAAFGMEVIAFDPFVSRETAERLGVELFDDVDALVRRCDYLTVHVPENDQTSGLIDAERIAAMKPGARIINCARGSVVDQDAAVAAVNAGRLGGVAFDVYVEEPPPDYGFTQSDCVVATPHLGASTEQAQLAVARQAAEQMIDALLRRHYRNALNMPAVSPEEMKSLQPYCDLAEGLGALVARINRGRPQSVEVLCSGEFAEGDVEPVLNHGAVGVVRAMLGDEVNVVSAPLLAEERGIRITSSTTVGTEAGFTDLVEVRLTTDKGTVSVAGTVFGREHPRVVNVAGHPVELVPRGELLFVFGRDMPGLIGKVGGLLGMAGVNIARMAFGREQAGGRALLALNLDCACDRQTLDRVNDLDAVEEVVAVRL